MVSMITAFADDYNLYSGDDLQYHDAGYDAYCTGLVFARLLHFLTRDQTGRLGYLPREYVEYTVLTAALSSARCFYC